MTDFKKGGPLQNSNIYATNRLFVKNPLFKKKKKKRAPGVYNPKAKFKYEDGGENKTKLTKEEEKQFQKFYKTLPENLQLDDNTYDIRGYWDGLGRPQEFDYTQPTESDGYYHAFSINPNTGEYLKSPAHDTFQHAVDEDRKIGYRPLTNVYGRNVAVENESIADPEAQTFLRNTQGPVSYKNGGEPPYNNLPPTYLTALRNFIYPNVSENPELVGYDSVNSTINYDSQSPIENMSNDWWREHELFHDLQNQAGGMSTSGVVGQRPNPYTASDESMQGYYDRRDADVNRTIDSMIAQDPNLQFIPREKLAQSNFDEETGEPIFIGAEDLQYADPSTLEGEARQYEQYIREGNPSIFPNKKNGGSIIDLTEEEIQKYIDGGYVVEEVNDPSIPALTKAAKGGSKKGCPEGQYWNGKKCTKLYTLKNDRKYIDGVANWAMHVDNNDVRKGITSEYNDQIKNRLYSGKWGFDPESGALIRLDKIQPQSVTTLDAKTKASREKEKLKEQHHYAEEENKKAYEQSITDAGFDPATFGKAKGVNTITGEPIYASSKEEADRINQEAINQAAIEGHAAVVNNPVFKAGAYMTPVGMAIGAIEGLARFIPDTATLVQDPTLANTGQLGLDVVQALPIIGKPVMAAAKNIPYIAKGTVMNPWEKEYAYRMLGNKGYEDAIESGVLRPNQNRPTIGGINIEDIGKVGPAKTNEIQAYTLFAPEKPWVSYGNWGFGAAGGSQQINMARVPQSNPLFTQELNPPGFMESMRSAKPVPITDPGVQMFEKKWWGWKPVYTSPKQYGGALKRFINGGEEDCPKGYMRSYDGKCVPSIDPEQVDADEWYRNWYANRVIQDEEGQRLLNEARPKILKRTENFPQVQYYSEPGTKEAGYYSPKTGDINLNSDVIDNNPFLKNEVLFHEKGHYLTYPSLKDPEMDTYKKMLQHPIHKMREYETDVIKKSLVSKRKVPKKDREYFKYVSGDYGEEISKRIMEMRRLAGFKPDQVITDKDVEDFYKKADEKGWTNPESDKFVEPLNDLKIYTKSPEEIKNLLNKLAKNEPEQVDEFQPQVARYGGRLDRFDNGGDTKPGVQNLQEATIYDPKTKKEQLSLFQQLRTAKEAYQNYTKQNKGKKWTLNAADPLSSSISDLKKQIQLYKDEFKKEKEETERELKRLESLKKKDAFKNNKDIQNLTLKDLSTVKGKAKLLDAARSSNLSGDEVSALYKGWGLDQADYNVKKGSGPNAVYSAKATEAAAMKDVPQFVDMVSNVATAIPLLGAAGAAGSAGAAILENPYVQAGLTGYGLYDATTNTLPEAYKDFSEGRYWEGLGNTALAGLDLVPGVGLAGKGAKLGAKGIKGAVNYGNDVIQTSKQAGKFALPKYKNVYRVEHAGFNQAANADDLTGRWFADNPIETKFYAQNLKDPVTGEVIKDAAAPTRVMQQRLPEYKVKQNFGAGMPEEARMMSMGRGDFTNTELDEMLGAGAGDRFTKGKFTESDLNAMETAPFLFRKEEGILDADMVNKLRGKTNAGRFSSGKSTVFDSQDKAIDYLFDEGAKTFKPKSKFSEYLPFKEGGATDDYIELDIPEEEIQWYIDNGYRVEPVTKLKKFIG